MGIALFAEMCALRYAPSRPIRGASMMGLPARAAQILLFGVIGEKDYLARYLPLQDIVERAGNLA